jgi:starch synthase
MTGLIPLFLKTAYKKEPVFSNSKVLFTIGQNTFDDTLDAGFLKNAIINASIKDKDLEPYKDLTNTSIFKGAATYADAISFGDGDVDKQIIDAFAKAKGKKVITYNPDSDLTEYLQLYNDLASK